MTDLRIVTDEELIKEIMNRFPDVILAATKRTNKEYVVDFLYRVSGCPFRIDGLLKRLGEHIDRCYYNEGEIDGDY